MPTDDIDKLSGPELSAAVAREVMGWAYIDPVIYEPIFAHRNTNPGWRVDGGKLLASDWNPHEDRNDAFRVLERYEEICGDWAELMRLIQGSEQGKRYFGMRLGLIVDPATICRAALRAAREAKR